MKNSGNNSENMKKLKRNADKPDSVEGNHLSGLIVTNQL